MEANTHRTIKVYYPVTEEYYSETGLSVNKIDNGESIENIRAFTPELESLTGYKISLLPVPKEISRRHAFTIHISDAFILGKAKIFFVPSRVPKEELLHELGHIEATMRFGTLIPSRYSLEIYSPNSLARLKDNLTAHLISDTVADLIVFEWSHRYFRAMIKKRCEHLAERKSYVLAVEEDIAHSLTQATMLRKLEKDYNLNYQELIKVYLKTYKTSVNEGFYLPGVSNQIKRIIRALIKQGVDVSFDIANQKSKHKARKLLWNYINTLEEKIPVGVC